MKFIIAIIKPSKLQEVHAALATVGVKGMTVTEVRGYGRQKGHLELYKGREYAISFIPKIKIEVVIPAGEKEGMIQAVSRAARTGRIGDGKVFLQGGDLIDLEPE